jgi:ABC-type spermidine/putrescine transport system permease subunit II
VGTGPGTNVPADYYPLPLPPSAAHWLGTTVFAQDAWSQLLVSTQATLFVGLLAAMIATLLSVLVGVAAGYLGGGADEGLSLLANVFLAIPGLPLLIVLADYMPSAGSSILLVAVIIAVTAWAYTARVLRAQTLSVRTRDFVEAARISGEGRLRIILAEVLPNLVPIVAASFLFTTLYAIGAYVAIAFLGLAGESGSGKTTLAMAAIRLLRAPGVITAGEVLFHSRPIKGSATRPDTTGVGTIDVLAAGTDQLRLVRWSEIAVVLQSAMNALNPVITIGAQFDDLLRVHLPRLSRPERWDRAGELFDMVGMNADRLRSYPRSRNGRRDYRRGEDMSIGLPRAARRDGGQGRRPRCRSILVAGALAALACAAPVTGGAATALAQARAPSQPSFGPNVYVVPEEVMPSV